MENETSSTHQSVAVTGVHRLRVAGYYSLLQGTNLCIDSASFRVGGYDWVIRYFPDGDNEDDGDDKPDHVSMFLLLLSDDVEDEVVTYFSFCLEDPASTTARTINEWVSKAKFSSKSWIWGTFKYISKTDLAASGCIQDDCLVIKCTVYVITSKLINCNQVEEDNGVAIAVPPSDLDNHLGRLLETGLASDITINQIKAHRCVLAARSPVLRALLCGSMMERKETSLEVEDIDDGVFKILIQYMYDDSMPAFMEETTEDATNMTKHLLVAADRFGMERLKLICERKLSMALDANTVCSTLEFADQHSCQQLKNFCVAYVVKDRQRLKAFVETQGFEQLTQNCPSVVSEILVKSLRID